MPKKKRRRGAIAAATTASTSWNWVSFPVFFAFSLGLLVAAVLVLAFNYAGWAVAGAVGLFGLSFGIAHMVTRPIARRRAERGQQPPTAAQR